MIRAIWVGTAPPRTNGRMGSIDPKPNLPHANVGIGIAPPSANFPNLNVCMLNVPDDISSPASCTFERRRRERIAKGYRVSWSRVLSHLKYLRGRIGRNPNSGLPSLFSRRFFPPARLRVREPANGPLSGVVRVPVTPKTPGRPVDRHSTLVFFLS